MATPTTWIGKIDFIMKGSCLYLNCSMDVKFVCRKLTSQFTTVEQQRYYGISMNGWRRRVSANSQYITSFYADLIMYFIRTCCVRGFVCAVDSESCRCDFMHVFGTAVNLTWADIWRNLFWVISKSWMIVHGELPNFNPYYYNFRKKYSSSD